MEFIRKSLIIINNKIKNIKGKIQMQPTKKEKITF